MININDFIGEFFDFTGNTHLFPWEVINHLDDLLAEKFNQLTDEYEISGNIAIHKTATIEQNVIFKDRIIIGENSFVGANAYLRGPVFVGKNSKIGPGCEIKQSIIYNDTAIAHFNYIGNSIIGNRINFEAGSICANHYNERKDKEISVLFNNEIIRTQTYKLGSLVGDDSRIGANAVLSPGTILPRESIIRRLELIEQVKADQ
ncbi:DapH/DapD/GlmU-related protein [Chryseobacterium sp. PTM-20240506]|uniref:DapH/DapD/GlmU-related protein n=1 Tax=unclassified Chryseobacterium TaxID=2593645 RepID=UPI002358F1E3|nr:MULTISPECIES: DapH/DapD/GlmU-related protein [unclassified Chryseobacterium]MDC8104366.1 LpxA family transferase [Chryseobacterium sp. B21-037]MDQ1803980.1 DapH/DapD/GlmU-related protein [Chryseobacterium sp. CKR4-1]